MRSTIASPNPAPLGELPIQYADFAAWQRQHLAGPLLARELDYWRGRLESAPEVTELSADRPRPAVQTFRGARRFLVLSPSLSEALRRLSRQVPADGVPVSVTFRPNLE